MDMRSHSTSPWGRVHGTVSSPSSIQPDCSSRVFLSPASTLLPLVTTSCGYTTMGRLPKFYNTYLTAFVATIGGSLFGFDISSMSAIIGTTQYNAYFNTPSSTLQGGITASMAGGSYIGSLLAGYASDRWGRRTAIQYSSLLWICGSIICCASQNVGMLIVGRFIDGLCVGVTSSQVPTYLSEIAKRKVRGKLVCCQQWAIDWGILVTVPCSDLLTNSR